MKRIALLAAATLLLAGCTTTTGPTAEPADGRISIVASTNVYGDVAKTVGGDLVSVTSLIATAAQDPHSFEASARDQLAVSKADVVIVNGGGYDPFMDTLIAASGSQATVLTATALSELADAAHGDTETDTEPDTDAPEPNEHVWYDLDTVDDLAHELAHLLGELDAANAATFEANYQAFATQIDALEARADTLEDSFEGQGVAVTEPVPLFLLEEVGLVNRTPHAFSEAIEEGGDVPPLALQQTLALFTDGSVVLLAYNEQTASPETERVRAEAEAAGIPVVSFTETLPDGQDYLSWMTANLDAISGALAR